VNDTSHQVRLGVVQVALESNPALVRRSFTVVSVILVVAGVAMVTYFASAIYLTHRVVEASLPCDPQVLTDTNPIIDPASYSLYTDEEVAASKAYEACFAGTRELLANEGITRLTNSIYAPLLVLADVLAVVLVSVGWTAGAAAPLQRRWFRILGALTVIGFAAAILQLQHLETIRLITLIVD
jgi:hypothetical protein